MAQTAMRSGITHERCADFRRGKKRQKRGEFITPPRPTGRRSNNRLNKNNKLIYSTSSDVNIFISQQQGKWCLSNQYWKESTH